MNGVFYSLKGVSVVSMLLILLPRYILDNIILVETNKNLQK